MSEDVKRIDLMHMLYGRKNGRHCNTCKHFCKIRTSRNIYKCRLYGITNSKATDWRHSDKACGMYNRELPEGFKTVMNRKKSGELICKEEELPPMQLEGQYNIFD